MKNYESEFNKATEALKGVRLSEAEKSAMLKNIYQETPVTAPIKSPFIMTSWFSSHRYAVSMAAIVLMVTGTAYASGDSLPGDPLYAFKVEVVEPMSMALHFSEESKNEYRVALLQERVEEIQELKEEGRLDFDLESISVGIAQENLEAIETSAVFSATGANLEVSGHVETYNAIVEEPHRLKTIIKVPDLIPEREEDEDENNEEDEEAQVPKTLVEEVTEETADTVEETAAALKDSTEKALEESEETIKEVVPTIKQIGL